MKTILFQGDSITDTYRWRDDDRAIGSGYPILIDAELGYNMPGKFLIINRGIGGNRSVDILQRWRTDCINLKPDYLSLMVGVNDVWHEIDFQNGIITERYEEYLRIMIEDVKNALPDIKIILMSPYITHGETTDKNWDYFRTEVDARIKASERISKLFNLPFINLQDKFDEALSIAPAENWTFEGVHPTSAGHKIIANAWLEVFGDGNF